MLNSNQPYPHTLAMAIEYDGTHFHGWQVQKTHISVQAILHQVLAEFTGHAVQTHAAGRTDAGVHAIAQIIHFHTNIQREPHAWVRACNTLLHKKGCQTIRILWAKYMPADFHARFHAIRRSYVYYLCVGHNAPACFRDYLGYQRLHSGQRLNAQAMRETSTYLLGKHDFSSFRSSECQATSPIKYLYNVDVFDCHPYYRFTFQANAFLHHMVRNLMGLLIAAGREKVLPEFAKTLLMKKNRLLAPPTFMANGLFFQHIQYEDHWGLHELNHNDQHFLSAVLGFS